LEKPIQSHDFQNYNILLNFVSDAFFIDISKRDVKYFVHSRQTMQMDRAWHRQNLKKDKRKLWKSERRAAFSYIPEEVSTAFEILHEQTNSLSTHDPTNLKCTWGTSYAPKNVERPKIFSWRVSQLVERRVATVSCRNRETAGDTMKQQGVCKPYDFIMHNTFYRTTKFHKLYSLCIARYTYNRNIIYITYWSMQTNVPQFRFICRRDDCLMNIFSI